MKNLVELQRQADAAQRAKIRAIRKYGSDSSQAEVARRIEDTAWSLLNKFRANQK